MTKILPLRIFSSLQSKIKQFNNQLNFKNIFTTNCDQKLVEESSIKKSSFWRLSTAKLNFFNERSLLCFMQKQLFFAQCLKLLVLFSVAIAQIIFLHPFLELFSNLEEYSAKFEFLQQIQLKQPILIVDSIHDLIEYKKNIWMTVAVLCAALSTSSFFLFLLPSNCSIRQWHVYLVGIFDAFSFSCLPFLFSTRGCIIQKIKLQIGQALIQAHKISSAEKLMNKAQCSVQPREKLPLCSDLILRSIFPVDLLKFLLILCAMTLAYLLVAYLIYWCIKHWVPHNNSDIIQSSSIFCHCYLNNNNLLTSPLLLENNNKCNNNHKQQQHYSFGNNSELLKNSFLIKESLPLPNKQILSF